jgi:hypothetical protein
VLKFLASYLFHLIFMGQYFASLMADFIEFDKNTKQNAVLHLSEQVESAAFHSPLLTGTHAHTFAIMYSQPTILRRV